MFFSAWWTTPAKLFSWIFKIKWLRNIKNLQLVSLKDESSFMGFAMDFTCYVRFGLVRPPIILALKEWGLNPYCWNTKYIAYFLKNVSYFEHFYSWNSATPSIDSILNYFYILLQTKCINLIIGISLISSLYFIILHEWYNCKIRTLLLRYVSMCYVFYRDWHPFDRFFIIYALILQKSY